MRHGRYILSVYSDTLVVRIKYTKTPAVFVAGHGRHSHQSRETWDFHPPVSVLSEAILPDHIKSTGVCMPCKTQLAIVLLHKFKMGFELFLPGIESFFKSRKVGEGIMAQQDPAFRSFQNGKFWQGLQEFQVLRTVVGLKFIIVYPNGVSG